MVTKQARNADWGRQALHQIGREEWGGRYKDGLQDQAKPRSFFKYKRKKISLSPRSGKKTYYYPLRTRKTWKTYGKHYPRTILKRKNNERR